VTQTIKLGTGICLVPERNPLLLAKEIATLDHFSGGQCHEMVNIIPTQAPQLHALEQALTGELRERLKEWVLA
jgi:alkanesulfonate monooxygenase SsuD/methylene tetrahydromethanopterin reductase-like flavin-dependent oxidoreductase (luciferase family)